MNTQREIDKFNIFKGIVIFLVVCIHILYKFHGRDKPLVLEAFNYITGFSVPLFMALGGFFLEPKLENNCSMQSLKLLFKRLVKRILVPYYIFITILIIFELLTGSSPSLKALFLIDVNTHGLYFIIIYIYSYIIASILSYLINKASNNNSIALLAITPAISLIFFPISNILSNRFPDSTVANNISLIPYFVFGLPLYKVMSHIDKSNKKLVVFSSLCIFSVIYTAILYYARTIVYDLPIFTIPVTIFQLIYTITAFILLLIILDNVKYVVDLGKLLYFDGFGKESLFIFLLHPYFMYLLPPLFLFFFKNTINHNTFIFPLLLSAYIITLFSYGVYRMLPPRIKQLFSR